MPNSIDVTGLQIQTLAEIVAEILNGAPGFQGYYQIYGADINVDQNSPDAQTINIFALGKEDTLQLIQQIYTGYDPTQAVGTQQDNLYAINGIQRKAGTRTTQLVTVTTTQGLTIAGVDTAPAAPFTVQDAAGNRFQLITTTVFSGASSQDLNFQSAVIGNVTVLANTLNVITTPQLGVESVTNGVLAGVPGTNQETDSAFRLRQQQSVAQPSRGYTAGLYAALLAIEGVLFASVLENDTSSTDGRGIPAHSIWVIVDMEDTTDLKDAVAQAIYTQKSMGCGMKGATTVDITQVDGTTFTIKFDFSIAEDLYFQAVVTAITGSVDTAFIAAQVLAEFGNAYGIGQKADQSSIVAFIKLIAPNASVSAAGVSTDGMSYVDLVTPSDVQHQFTIPDLSKIDIT